MNGIYLYFVNKHFLVGRYWDFKEIADNNFRSDENGGKLSERVENTVRKGEIARYDQFLLFPSEFSKDL